MPTSSRALPVTKNAKIGKNQFAPIEDNEESEFNG
jgi:hypothetical protein